MILVNEQSHSMNIQSSAGLKGITMLSALEILKGYIYSMKDDVNSFSLIVYEYVKIIGFSPYNFDGNFKPTIVSKFVSKENLLDLIEKAG